MLILRENRIFLIIDSLYYLAFNSLKLRNVFISMPYQSVRKMDLALMFDCKHLLTGLDKVTI
jgi:hypothetical protein